MYKIIGADQKEYGPVSSEQIRQWITEGRVNGQTRARLEGEQDWKPLSAFLEFTFQSEVPPGAISAVQPGPGVVTPPPTIKVFGILNIVFGSLGLLCSPLSIIGIPLASKQFENQPMMVSWLFISAIISLIGAVILLTSGIGLLKCKAWARKLAVYYAVFACIMAIAGTAITLVSFSGNMTMEAPQRVGGIIGGIAGGIIGMVYYILLIVFLSKPKVKEALGEMV